MYVYAAINKITLRFIRESTKVSFEYIKKKFKFDQQRILEWEDTSTSSLPTINQAKALAKCFRIPFAGLYMNSKDIKFEHIPNLINMRTIHSSNQQDDSVLNLAVIDLLNARDLLISTKAELNEKPINYTPSFYSSTNVSDWADKIRNHFNIKLSEQYKSSSTRQFYLYLKNKIEQHSIFVHCFTGVNLNVARGLAIYDSKMPMIGINDDDRYPAKSFTIIHELVHIIKQTSAVCNDFYNSFLALQDEVFCNAVAGEVLVTVKALEIILKHTRPITFTINEIDTLANKFSVSKEVIIRRLLDLDYIDKIQYDTFASEFKVQYEKEKEAEKERHAAGEPSSFRKNPSREAFDKASLTLCKTLFRGMGEGLLDKQDVSRYLNIGQKHVDKLFHEVSSWDN